MDIAHGHDAGAWSAQELHDVSLRGEVLQGSYCSFSSSVLFLLSISGEQKSLLRCSNLAHRNPKRHTSHRTCAVCTVTTVDLKGGNER
jgi:hypothetical protein